MSEVKHELCVVYPATLGYETDYRPATTAEIMEAHPKCGECRHSVVHHSNFGECFNKDNMEYDHQYDAYAAMNIQDPYEHYCRHWEGKE